MAGAPNEASTLAYRVARRIAARRRERGLSQEGLATLLDIAVKNVQRIESGKQNLSLATLERIAKALEVEPEQLVAGDIASGSASRAVTVLDRLERGGFPVRRATERGRRPEDAVAVTTLRAAAGQLTGEAAAIEVLGWVNLARRAPPPEGQFVAEVTGASMSPTIPAGAICLFGRPAPPPIDGRILLVAHEALADVDLGGPYALKRVRTNVRRKGRFVLESINPEFEPITIEPGADEVRVVAELVRVLVT